MPVTHSRGFSLAEVMVAMVIASVGVLAVSQGTISSLGNDTLARERIAATHLAMDVIESWQASSSDTLPALECTNGTITLTTSGSQTCTMISKEVQTLFTITISTANMQAPLQPALSGSPTTADLYAGLRIGALLVDKNDNTHLYAGTGGYGIFESNDSGATWSRINPTGYTTINDLTQYDSSATVVVAGSDSYAMANTDWGGSWQQIPGSGSTALPSEANVLSVATDSSGTLYAGLDVYTNVNYGGVFKSLDSGVSWSSVLGSNSDPYTVYALVAASDGYTYAGTDQGIRFTTDGGSSWSTMATAPAGSTDVYALAYDSGSGTLLAGTSDGISTTTDHGASWNHTDHANANGKKILDIAIDSNGKVVAATARDGVYVELCSSNNFPAAGLDYKPDLRVYSVAVKADGSVVYAGTDRGLFKLDTTDCAAGWSRSDDGIGLYPKEKIVTVTWDHKQTSHSVVLTHATEKPY
ncbi:MAG: prepilin-type N-terminal cleavage/methylation domain-containing protein [Zetaproteobacteria bacterium]|nr:MAG: prepilin-type N-terminal cleavage/methylation domain-containing protein [Zetaproteobacteria bacterium]